VSRPVAAEAVVVVSLGDAEALELPRLPEAAAAMVDAAATVGARDVATVVHAAGSVGLDPREAARLLACGLLAALDSVPGAEVLREVTIVERDAARLEEIRAGIEAATAAVGVHVYVEELAVTRTLAELPAEPGRVADHLRLGVTRSGAELKVTTIGEGAFDVAELLPFPDDVAAKVAGNLRAEVLDEGRAKRREAALGSLGAQLYNAFLGDANLGIDERVRQAPGGFVVLRLDEWTADLPWEITHVGDEAMALQTRMARQLELRTPGRQAAFVPEHPRLRVLVVGDPTGDLPAAAREARAVARLLKSEAAADVTALVGGATYSDVSARLDSEDFDVLHYAGHAEFDDLHEDVSGLVLADGRLTAQDLASRRHLPRLVFANACHSAATGDARMQELDTAARATRNVVSGVLGAGARAFIGAQWEVDDKAAATFARAVYRELLAREGSPRGTVGEAVRRGRAAVVEEHGAGEPAWAAYALYGSPWQAAW
jgi:hypothetical protein